MEIIYSDDYFVAVNKPAGLLSIQDGYDLTLPNVKSILDTQFGRTWIVHRIDKETSGVLLFALNPKVHRELCMQFENRIVHKKYLALIHGNPNQKIFTVNLPLRINGDRRHRTVFDQVKGKPATTFVSVLHTFQNTSVVEISPFTGYTHQIRSHLTAVGFPIVGDTLYQGKDQSDVEFSHLKRLALHAYQLQFLHPYQNCSIELVAPLPPDLAFLTDYKKRENI